MAEEGILTSDDRVAVIRGRTEDYPDRHPGANEVGMIVEIADATLLRNRTPKARVYARAGIPTYWIVNQVEGFVEVY